jgi:DNA-binding transcriptional MocR family regulator
MSNGEITQIVDAAKERIAKDIRGAVNVLGRHQIAWAQDVPFLWLSLPMGWRAGEFIQAAETAGVLIKSAEDFSLRDGRAVHAIRIAVNGQMTHERFIEAMGVLRALLDNAPERLDV